MWREMEKKAPFVDCQEQYVRKSTFFMYYQPIFFQIEKWIENICVLKK